MIFTRGVHPEMSANSATIDQSTSVADMDNESGFSSSMLTFAAIMTLLIMVVGIVGNFLTVAALIKCPKVRNVAAAFIMSLCIADLLFCALVLPFSAYRFIEGSWTPHEVLCKMIPFIQYGNIGVSLLCIAMITINRYVMIAHHGAYGRIYKRHWIAAMIVFCWVFSYGMQLPTLFGAWGTFDYDPKLGTCSIMSDQNGRSSKSALFVTAFVIPCIIIIACYAKIFWVVHQSEQRLKRHANKQNSIPNNLRVLPPTTPSHTENGLNRFPTTADSGHSSSSFSTDQKQEALQKQQPSRVRDQREVRAKRNEWRITKMVLAIFLSFLVCYLPITIVKVADADVQHPGLHILSYIMLYLSACINPIIYVIMNKQYRKAYKTVLQCEPSRLWSFGKGGVCGGSGGGGGGGGVGGGGAGGGSSAAEKWNDTALSHNHSRTMVSQMSVAELPPPQQQPSVNNGGGGHSAALNSLELTAKLNALAVANLIPMPPTTADEAATVPFSHPSALGQTASREPKESNRIALIGGDIILEEEEEEETEKEAEGANGRDAPDSRPPTPTRAAPATRPAPVYVNASVLHSKRNPFYGPNINDIPDNLHQDSTKLQTKPQI